MILEDYLSVNETVAPRDALLTLAPFALFYPLGGPRYSTFFDLSTATIYRHRPWFLWNTMRLSGLEHLWMADELNRDEITLQAWMRRVKREGDPEALETWRKLLYTRNLPQPKGDRAPGRFYTKGGGWNKHWPMSRLLVLGESIDRPDCWWNTGPRRKHIERLEFELQQAADPDKDLMPAQYERAIRYVRDRSWDLYSRRMAPWSVVWFFQQKLNYFWIRRDLWYGLNPETRRGWHMAKRVKQRHPICW